VGAAGRKVRTALGVCYLVAGIGKCVPSWESTEQRLGQALKANRNTPLEGPTRWLHERHEGTNAFVAASMVGAGAALLSDDGRVVDAALVGTLPMLGSFATLLHRALPPVVPVDAAFGAAAVWVLRQRRLAAKASRSA